MSFIAIVADSSDYTIPLSRQSSTDSSSRGLVRSHSFPNIAQMVNEEDNTQHKMPVVDRSLKPKYAYSISLIYKISFHYCFK